jgi:hypothetical protein
MERGDPPSCESNPSFSLNERNGGGETDVKMSQPGRLYVGLARPLETCMALDLDLMRTFLAVQASLAVRGQTDLLVQQLQQGPEWLRELPPNERRIAEVILESLREHLGRFPGEFGGSCPAAA